jgi:hypothetical protein
MLFVLEATASLVGFLLLGWAVMWVLIMTFVLAAVIELLHLPAQTVRWLPWTLGLVLWLRWLWRETRDRPREPVGPEHVCTRGAVRIVRFDARFVTLRILREEYALEFARANAQKHS